MLTKNKVTCDHCKGVGCNYCDGTGKLMNFVINFNMPYSENLFKNASLTGTQYSDIIKKILKIND